MYYIVLLLLCIPEIFLNWKKDNSLAKYLLKGCQVKKSGIHYETVFIILFLNARGKIYLTKVKCTRCKSCKITTMEVRECEKRIQKVEQSILTKNTLLMVKKKKVTNSSLNTHYSAIWHDCYSPVFPMPSKTWAGLTTSVSQFSCSVVSDSWRLALT